MYDFWIGDVNFAPILLIFTFAVLFPVQLILCFRGKTKVVRLLPVMIMAVLTSAAVIAAFVSTGYEIILFIVCAVYFAMMLLVCGAAWGIWIIFQFWRRKRLGS